MENKIQEITDQNLQQYLKDSTKPVVIDFWAPRCGPCRMLSPMLDKLAEDFGDSINFLKINVDNNPVSAMTFGVRGIPSVIIFNNGQVVESVVGVRSPQEYEQIFQKLIEK